MMRGRRFVIPVLVALAMLAGGAGCGGGDAAAPAAGDPVGFEELARSAGASAEAKSGRFSFSMSMSFAGSQDPFGFSGEGAFDSASERASFSMDMSSFAKLLGGIASGLAGSNAKDVLDFDDPSAWQIDVIQDGATGYVRFPAAAGQLPEGKSWFRVEEGDTSLGAFELGEQFATNDPRELLDSLRAVTGDVETVGVEPLRGVETTHYRAVIDPAELAKLAPRDAPTGAGSFVDQLTAETGLGEVPVDVWIDSGGLVRKLSMAFSPKESGTAQAGEASMEFELWDYGETVEIELPPESEVADASALRD